MMLRRSRRVLRFAFAAAVVLVAAGVLAPYQSADRYRGRIRLSLEQALRRKVEIQGPVRFNLFTGPGFTAENIVIHELPEYGIEPIAYVSEMDARVRLLGLLTGRMEFSTLRLNEPSVNLVKTSDHGWNLQAFFGNQAAAEASHLPVILVRGGRIHFKFDDTKSLFYLTNADMDLSAPSGNVPGVDLWFAGEPARTDRAAQGLGRLVARGRWVHGPKSRFDFDLELEKGDLDQLSELFRGQGFGLHGLVTSRMRLEGPPADVHLAGSAQIEDIHRWDLMPSKGGGWRVPLEGTLSLTGQTLDLQTGDRDKLPLAFELHARDLLSRVKWTAAVRLDGLPVAPLLEVARHMGVPPAAKVQMDGAVSGAVSYQPENGFSGELALSNFQLRAPKAPPVAEGEARLVFDGFNARLLAAGGSGPNARVSLEGRLDLSTGTLDVAFTGKGIPVSELHTASGRLFGAEPIPVLESCDQGLVTGRLDYHRAPSGSGKWSGGFDLTSARVSVPGLSAPVQIISAAVSLDGERVVAKAMRASAGTLEFRGEYRYEPESAHPHRFDLAAHQVDAGLLERLLKPVLRRPQSFLARTLRLGAGAADLPQWLEKRHAEGTIKVDVMTLGPVRLEDVRSRLRWDAARISSTGVQFVLEEGSGSGYFTVNLREAVPDYRAGARVRDLSWNGARFDLDGVLLTAGTGAEVLANLRSEGNFEGRGIPGPAEGQIRSASGSYQLTVARDVPRLRFTGLQMVMGAETFRGDGGNSSDGKLRVRLWNGERQLELSVLTSPFQLEVVAP